MARDTNNSEKFARKKNTKKYEKKVQRPNFICRFHGSQPLERSFDSEKLRWKTQKDAGKSRIDNPTET